MHRVIASLTLLLIWLSACTGQLTIEQRAQLPTPISVLSELEVAAELAIPPADEATERLQTPPGFMVHIFFSNLRGPRLMTVGPDDHLYVAERDANAVVRLPDANHDGLADERQVVAERLNEPHSVEWHQGELYVATNDLVLRMSDSNADGDFLDDGEQITVTDNIPSGGGHSTRTLHIGPDGKLYVAAGSSSNINVESDRRRATLMRFNLDGSIPDDNPFAQDPEETRRPVWAEGLRNSVDFLFLPDGRLWADHNGSDQLGDDLPPEEIVIEVEKGKHYGWPYCYTPTLGATPSDTLEVEDERIEFDQWLASCQAATPALFTDLAHQAPLGMVYYARGSFPVEYWESLFVAYHGSWNSSVPRDCKIERIILQDGQPVASEPFVTGFRDNDQQSCGGAWGRPAGLAVGLQGELFISDDENGNIYRVVYTGDKMKE
jgi:glucose/arabinose dehydrogenase